MHDISKLLPSEWMPYMNYFSDEAFNAMKEYRMQLESQILLGGLTRGETIDVAACVAEIDKRQNAFDAAWLKHQHRNKHHWQHWLLVEDSGGMKVLPMPAVYVTEMVCDWIGAGIAITGKRDVVAWYEANKHKMQLHPETRGLVEQLLGRL